MTASNFHQNYQDFVENRELKTPMNSSKHLGEFAKQMVCWKIDSAQFYLFAFNKLKQNGSKIGVNANHSWQQAELEFLRHFQNPHQQQVWLKQIHDLKQGKRTCQTYIDEFLLLAGKLHWNLTSETA